MKISELLNEIAHGSEIPILNWDPSYLDKCTVFCQVEGYDVLSLIDSGINFYLTLDNNVNLLAYVATSDGKYSGYKNLIRIENKTRINGLATALVFGLIAAGMKFVIDETEPVTLSAMEWINKIINHPRGLKITDQDGNKIDIQALHNERFDALSSGNHGPTAILISENAIISENIRKNNKIWKSNALLKPTYIFIGDENFL